jgi:hypothetical protein
MAIKNLNLVLAHGRWADGFSWDPLIRALQPEVPEGALAKDGASP